MKTKKGTELQLLKLKGKDYLPVAQRLVWFREEHPGWTIETSFLQLGEAFAIARAEVRDDGGRVLATSHKREDQKHFPDFMEKAETGAIGRALALCGFGTQFAPELDEEERIVDSPQPTRYASEEAVKDLLAYAQAHGISSDRVQKLAQHLGASLEFLPLNTFEDMRLRIRKRITNGENE